ncbi:MAG: putative toxin-antitoxin system toxin component, PIN family [Chloroflexia bacterium]|nr:putative toxin-antitoxin system toxin component, PIN family [Chloroflexia bacterium]
MIRAVVDVNVLVSGFPARQGGPAEILAAWTDQTFELVISEHILREMVDAWSKPYLRARFGPDEVRAAVDRLRTKATFVIPVDTVFSIADDEEDDLVLATAVAGEVPYLVTGDYGLQRIGRYGDIMILSPRAFLDVPEVEASWQDDDPG